MGDIDIVKLLEDEALISRRGDKYYSECAIGEEITIEINNIIKKLEG